MAIVDRFWLLDLHAYHIVTDEPCEIETFSVAEALAKALHSHWEHTRGFLGLQDQLLRWWGTVMSLPSVGACANMLSTA